MLKELEYKNMCEFVIDVIVGVDNFKGEWKMFKKPDLLIMLNMPKYQELVELIKKIKNSKDDAKILAELKSQKSCMIITLILSMVFSKQLKDLDVHLDFSNLLGYFTEE